MRLFNSGRIYNFMGMRKIFIPLSLGFVLFSLGLLIFGKPNLGTDFVGGTEIELAFKGHLEAGEVRWRARLNSAVSTPPLVAGERVFAMGVDRVVHAFDVLDGRKLWVLQRPGDALTISAAGVVAPFQNTLLVGQGPRLTGVDPLRGAIRWEVPIASPRGTNEVERLADLIGPVVRAGDVVCARAFQSAVGCADAANAREPAKRCSEPVVERGSTCCIVVSRQRHVERVDAGRIEAAVDRGEPHEAVEEEPGTREQNHPGACLSREEQTR